MTSPPHLTILVATLTRGRPQMLRALIESWGAMDVPPACDVSCLVVENALRPLSLPVVQAAQPLPNGLRVDHVLEPEPGIPFARNRAAREAIGRGADLLAFVDDDEVVTRDWLLRLVAGYRASDAVLLGAPLRIAPLMGPVGWTERLMYRNIAERYRRKEARATQRAGLHGTPGVTIVTNNWLAETRIFTDHGIWFDESMRHTGGTDAKFHADVRQRGLPTAWVADAVVHEIVPAERLSFRYQFRRGRDQSNTAFHRKLADRPLALLGLFGILPLRLVMVLALAFALPLTKGRTLLPLARGMGWIAGRIGATLGRRSTLYQEVTGV
ncbi:MAG: glycosyl transferase [Rhodobacteraceae bacterium PARR1]|nr:MAG: glycosyl transferase [Rhodobacteraceae bacterium PARR1]